MHFNTCPVGAQREKRGPYLEITASDSGMDSSSIASTCGASGRRGPGGHTMLGCLLGGGGVGSSLLRCLQPDNKEGLVRASPRPDDERATSLEGGGFQDDRVISPPGGVPAGGSPLMGWVEK
eukprot:1158349-Pelagomonas_calceolata.AAC.1